MDTTIFKYGELPDSKKFTPESISKQFPDVLKKIGNDFKNIVISLIKPLIPGSASEAKELAKKKAKVIGKTFAKPPIFGIERVFVLS